MKVTWKDLAFLPSDAALAAIRESWSWLLPQEFHPLMASKMGDVFFQREGNDVYWLNTGTAEIERVAGSREEFQQLLGTEKAHEWLMPSLIEELMAAGKTLKSDHCYTYVTLPIFKEGKYEVANLNSVPAEEHFRITGEVHRQLKDLLDGTRVKAIVTKEEPGDCRPTE